jgi:hypothetical protein
VKKTIAYPNWSPSEICASDLHNCTPRLGGPSLLESVDELEEERILYNLGNAIVVIDYPHKIRYL